MTNEERLSRLSPTRARQFLRNLACAAALSAAMAAGAQALQLTTEAALKEPAVQAAIEAFWTDRGVGSPLVG